MTPLFRFCLLLTWAHAAGATALHAQERAPARSGAATAVATALAPARAAAPAAAARALAPAPAPPLADRRPPFARVAAGTAIGALLGGAVGAGAGALFGSMEAESDGFISAAAALGMVGLAVGYTGGAAVGARRAATEDGARPSLARLLLVSAGSAALGGLVWNQVGGAFESPESMASWYAGAAAGVVTHLGLTALAAQRAPAVRPAVVPAPGDPDA